MLQLPGGLLLRAGRSASRAPGLLLRITPGEGWPAVALSARVAGWRAGVFW